MTSGQDTGSPREPEDPPGSAPPGPGWAPAPPPPPSSPGPGHPQGGYPQGGFPPAPPGYPSYPGQGYGPAPSAPQGYGTPPPAMERPTTVMAGVVAFIAYVILGLISAIIQFSDIDNLVREAVAAAGGSSAGLSQATVRTAVIAGGVIALLFAALEGLFIWFAWQGRNWARIVLWVIGGLAIAGGLVSVAGNSYLPGFLRGLSICQFVLVLAGVILLARRASSEWYRYRSWLRATGQRG